MVAYPALLNPRFFRGGEKADGVELLHEYLSYVERYPAQSKTIKSHARKLLKPMYAHDTHNTCDTTHDTRHTTHDTHNTRAFTMGRAQVGQTQGPAGAAGGVGRAGPGHRLSGPANSAGAQVPH
jgi:hypothetical protein